MKFTTTGQEIRTQEQEVEAESPLEACIAHYDRFGVCPDSVAREDGTAEDVVGLCENCGLPILENGDWEVDNEGVVWHEVCPERPAAGGSE